MKAWRVEVDTIACVTFAPTRAKAKWIAVSSYWDTGFGEQGRWPPTTIERQPHLDLCMLRDHRPARVWTPGFVESYPRFEVAASEKPA